MKPQSLGPTAPAHPSHCANGETKLGVAGMCPSSGGEYQNQGPSYSFHNSLLSTSHVLGIGGIVVNKQLRAGPVEPSA